MELKRAERYEPVAYNVLIGFDMNHFRHALSLLQKGLEEKLFSCASYCLMRDGMIYVDGGIGTAQPDSSPPVPAALDTIFDMASITKPITATLLVLSAERGELHLGMRVREFLPEAETAPCANLTLRQLATHTSGLPPWKPLYENPNESALTQILATALETEPGTKYAYSDLGYILLGEILQRVTGTPLDILAQSQIFDPLDMRDTGYRPDARLHPRIAATANCPWRKDKILVGEVHDANCWSMGGVSGHAGLFSTAHDIARFAAGTFAAQAGSPYPKLFSWEAQRLMVASQIPASVGGHSIGCFTVPNGMLPRGDFFSDTTFGHTGFTGTSMMHDPIDTTTIILLTNRVHSVQDGAKFLRLRWLFANAVSSSFRMNVATKAPDISGDISDFNALD